MADESNAKPERKDSRMADIDRRLDRIAKIQEEMALSEAKRQQEDELDKFKEAKRQQEAEQRQKEAEQRQKEAEQRQKEAVQRQAGVERQLEKTSLEVEKLSKSVKALRQHVGGQDNRWSRIVESLVAGSLSEILAVSLQIQVNYASTRVKGTHQGKNWEIDVLAVNEGTVVPVEVKTTLKQDDIDYFIARILARFTQLIPTLKDNKIYGAIAFVKIEGNEDSVINYATSKGLIVIKAMRGTNHIINPKDRQPRDFNPHN